MLCIVGFSQDIHKDYFNPSFQKSGKFNLPVPMKSICFFPGSACEKTGRTGSWESPDWVADEQRIYI